MKNTLVEISIPILNEEQVLEKNIRITLDYLEHLNISGVHWQVVVADNGSSDRSPDIMERLCTQFPQLRYLRIDQIGVGLALKTAWKCSNADIVGYMDIDLATPLEHLREMVSAMIDQQYEVVYGTRLHKNSIVKGRSLKREITSRIFNWLLRRYLGVKFSDGMCGFKFMNRNVALALIKNGAQSDGWFFSTELLYIAERYHYKMYELPITWNDSRDSKVKIGRLSLQYLKAMYRIKKQVGSLGAN